MSTAVQTSAQPTATTSRKRKDPFLSNAKFILIVLVVWGHAIEPLRDVAAARAGYILVYDLHMPAFILISGYLSRSFTGRPDQLRRLLTGIVLPYLVFSLAYGGLRVITEGGFVWNAFFPWWLLWFLPALFMWRLTAPFWRVVRWPIPVSFAIALGATIPNLSEMLDIPRMLMFLPFFVIGTQLKREHFDLLRRPWIRYGGLAVSLALCLVVYALGDRLSTDVISYAQGYWALHMPGVEFEVGRVAAYAAALVLVATFLAWVPRREFRWTALGERTIYAYLLHGFVVRLANEEWDLFRFGPLHGVAGVLLVSALAVVFAVLLMTAPVARAFRWAVEPRVPWLFQADEPPARAADRERKPELVAVRVPPRVPEPSTAVVVARASLDDGAARGLLSRVNTSPARRVEPLGV